MSKDVENGSRSDPAGQPEDPHPFYHRLRRIIIGAPRSLTDGRIFHKLSLVPFLAWIGLGADGLSSSSYGPQEAFVNLGPHTYLAPLVAAVMITTIVIISRAYSHIIEQFPSGGGGYVVGTKLLGDRAGLVSGSALIVDYIQTIAISIAAAGDALFSFVPLEWHVLKLPVEALAIICLTALNIRGVRESVLTLMPVFILFLVTHAVLIVGGIVLHAPQVPKTTIEMANGFQAGYAALGVGGLLAVFVRAYSLGGGTYTGIEAVSNGLPIMRQPKVVTGKRTMAYMAASLAFTAGGLLVCYLLWDVTHVVGKTHNAVFVERFVSVVPLGTVFVVLTMISEGALLVVAAQAGFLDGPRVLANMANDSWVPHGFSALSERLTTQNGIMLMGGSALAVLVFTLGDVRHLVVVYSINVFLTFSLSMLGMALHTWKTRPERGHWKRRFSLFAVGLVLCATMLVMMTVMKFGQGGWVSFVMTGSLVSLAFLIRRHYRAVTRAVHQLDDDLANLRGTNGKPTGEPDPSQQTAVVLVTQFGGMGVHTMLNALRSFPNHFKSIVFVGVGVVDSGEFKGEEAIGQLRERTEWSLREYVSFAHSLGIPATYRFSLGTDVVEEVEKLCLQIAAEFPRATFFGGKLIFEREKWYQRLLHNETAYAIQKRLQWDGKTMVILPVRVRR